VAVAGFDGGSLTSARGQPNPAIWIRRLQCCPQELPAAGAGLCAVGQIPRHL